MNKQLLLLSILITVGLSGFGQIRPLSDKNLLSSEKNNFTETQISNNNNHGSLSFKSSGATKNNPAFLFESFDQVTDFSQPNGWFGNFVVRPTGGVLGSKRFTRNLYSLPEFQTGEWQTSAVDITSGSVFEFSYRVVNDTGYPNTPTSGSDFEFVFKISTDLGETFSNLHIINSSNHTVSTAYAQVTVDLQAYAGQTVIVRLEAARLAGDFWADFDNIRIGAFYNVSFLVTNGSIPLAGARIEVENLGFELTNASGQASFKAPNGSFDFDIIAANYITYDIGNFTINNDNVSVPEIQLIGFFPVNFTARDQDLQLLDNALISYTGTARGYEGDIAVSGSVNTSGLGIANVTLRNGEYNTTVTKTNFYTVSDEFTVNNAIVNVAIQMQVFPLVTFNVVEEIDNEGTIEQIAIEGATVVVEGYPSLVTNALGQASRRLAIGPYNLTATKVGFLNANAGFEVLSNIDFSPAPVVMERAPAQFAFVTDVSQGISLAKTLVGQSSATKTIVFTNTGSGSLNIAPSDISIVGDHASEFLLNNLAAPVSLAAGEQASVSVAFTPGSAGAKTATLRIEDNLAGKILHDVVLLAESYNAVQLPFTENFESGNFNNWIVINGTQTNQWHVGHAAGNPGNLSAIVSNDGGVTNSYQTGGIGAASVVHFYMDFEIPAADPGEVKLYFNWKSRGETTNPDRVRVYIRNVSDVVTEGAELSPANQIGTYFNNPVWQTVTHNIATEHLGTTRRIVFTWRNNGSLGEQPPAAVDNIYIGRFYNLQLAANPSVAGVLTGAGSYGDGFKIPISASPATGYVFQSWTAADGILENANLASTSFTMPGSNTTVTANFIPEPPVAQNQTFTYNGTERTASATVNPGFEVVWYEASSGGDPVSQLAATNAGIYSAWAASKDSSGNESQRTEVTLTILPADLELTADPIQKAYGDEDPAFTWLVTGGELFVGDMLSGQPGREEGEDTGTYAINVGSLANNNYNITLVSDDLTIAPAPLNVTAQNKAKTFDGEIFPLDQYTVVYAGFRFNDDASVLSGNLEFSGDAISATEIGEYTIIPGGLSSSNYNIEYFNGVLTITEQVIISAEGFVVLDKVYDATTIAEIDYSGVVLTGVISGDDVTLITENAEANFTEVNVGNGITVTITGLTLEGVDAFKYLLELPAITGNITPRNIEVSANAGQSKIFGESDPAAFTYSIISGELAGGDQLTGMLVREAGEEVGTYDILVGTLDAGSNYQLDFVSSVFTIYALLTLEASPEGSGSVTGGGQYITDDMVSVSAVAGTGYEFLNWRDTEGNIISELPSFEYTMPGLNITLIAWFDLIDFVDDFVSKSVNIYPNPARDRIFISSGSNINRIIIADMAGKIISDTNSSGVETSISVHNLVTGAYIVRIHTEEGIAIRKLLIKK